MLPEIEDEKREEPKTVDLQQSDSAKLEKEAMNSIQHQSEELEKYLEPSSEPRFSLMKFLRRERRSGAEESSPSTSTSSDGGDNNGLPSYSEATSEAADTETAAVTVVDGATQTVEEEEERNEDAPDNDADTTLDVDQNESERTENPSTDINTNSRPSFRIFSFLKK